MSSERQPDDLTQSSDAHRAGASSPPPAPPSPADGDATRSTQNGDPPAPSPHDATTIDAAQNNPGFPLVDGYEIRGRLGEGGMGTVWHALQLGTQREVALKLMSDRVFRSKRAQHRFEREVQLAAKLDHPNIAAIYEAGLHKGVYYYAMRLVRGVPLDNYIEREKLDRRAILELMQKVCEAVGHAHEQGILHRDLKPSNVMVNAKRRPFVLDFGLAKALDEDTEVTTTQEGDTVGTPAYMSPEQAQGRVHDIDTRTDVYALGVMIYMLLTGRHPTDLTGSRFEVLERIVRQEIRPLREVSGDIDIGLESIVMAALAKQRDQRFPDAGALAAAIAHYLRSTAQSSPLQRPAPSGGHTVASPAAEPNDAPAPSRASRPGTTGTTPGRSPGLKVAGIAAGLIVVASIVAVIAWQSGGGARNETKVSPPIGTHTANPASRDVIVPEDGWVSLLDMCDPALHAVKGSWRREDNSLTVGASDEHSRMVLPVAPAGDYEMEIEFTRLTDEGELCVIPTVANVQCALTLNGWQGKYDSIWTIDGQAPKVEFAAPLGKGRRHVLKVVVKHEPTRVSIASWLDGKPHLSFAGRADTRFELHSNWRLPRSDTLGIGAYSAGVQYHRIDFRALDKQAHILPRGSSLVDQAVQDWTDLLVLTDAERDGFDGDWRREGQAIVIEDAPTNNNRLLLPVRVDGNYQFKCTFTHVRGWNKGGMFLQVPVRSRQITVALDHGGESGLEKVEGHFARSGNPTYRLGQLLEDGRTHEVDVRVSSQQDQVSIRVRLDARSVIEWTGPFDQLTTNAYWTLPRGMIGFGALTGTTLRIESASLLMLDGQANAVMPVRDEVLELSKGLVAYWPFDDGAGDKAIDATGHGHDATLRGNATDMWVTDRSALPPVEGNRGALQLDGGENHVELGTLGRWGSAQRRVGSVSLWLKTTNQSNAYLLHAGGNKDGRSDFSLMVTMHQNNKAYPGAVTLYQKDEDDNYAFFWTRQETAAVNGGWHHLVVTWDGNTPEGEVYLDGKSIPTDPTSKNLQPFTQFRDLVAPLLLGGERATDSVKPSFQGLLDDVRIYDRVLNKGEIKALAAGRVK